jgi:hypothetical protein
MRLTEQQIADWQTALRSGEYKQSHDGHWYSSLTDTYCCLGVLAVAVLGIDKTLEKEGKRVQTSGCAVEDTFEDIGGRAPDVHFWGLNDMVGLSFSEIADHIDTMKRIPELVDNS